MLSSKDASAVSWRAEGPRVFIVPFSEDHLTARYVGWLNDPETTRYSELRHRRHSLETCRQYLESVRASGHFFGAIHRKHDNSHIGNITAYLDPANGIADLAIIIGEQSIHRQGFGSEAWIAMMNLLIGQKRVRKVTGGAMQINQPMLRVFVKAGMHEEAIRRRHFVVEGHEVDVVLFTRFAGEGIVEFPD